jgi:Domain of unknown function (DUF427)
MSNLTFRRRPAAGRGHEHPSVRVQTTWHGTVSADSERTISIEGNHYFPPEDVFTEYLSESGRHTTCPWKGEASYYDVVVDGNRNEAAACITRSLPRRPPRSATTLPSGTASRPMRSDPSRTGSTRDAPAATTRAGSGPDSLGHIRVNGGSSNERDDHGG